MDDAAKLDSDYWSQRYRDGRTGWDRGQPSPALQSMLSLLDRPSLRILVPGCGAGHEVIELAKRGQFVVGVDFSAEALMRLQGGLTQLDLTAELLQDDVIDLQLEQPVDVIYEQTCLCALEPALREAYESQLHHWLKTDGLLFALFMQTGREGGPPFDCDLDEMRKLFPDSRWNWPVDIRQVEHPTGVFEFAVALRKKQDN